MLCTTRNQPTIHPLDTTPQLLDKEGIKLEELLLIEDGLRAIAATVQRVQQVSQDAENKHFQVRARGFLLCFVFPCFFLLFNRKIERVWKGLGPLPGPRIPLVPIQQMRLAAMDQNFQMQSRRGVLGREVGGLGEVGGGRERWCWGLH